MRFFEVEQKYKLKDPSRTRMLLKKLGAKKVASGLESNEFYDKGKFLRKQKLALRLRKFGNRPATLTLKGPRIKARFTKRMEVEVPIGYAAAKAVLDLLGYRVCRRYSKNRELYKLGRAFVTVDFLKRYGWFLEIEGRSRVIRKFEKNLGLRSADREPRSYLQMMFGWKH